ncbi:MAG TPA: ATP-dependent Clp protease ATP-binding subunit ClpX, partial [Candidatus Onthomorpha intestinigallinarum]|nr:ATP-dependent Clp protease ATP-binding subunit ClpX [Candidatus Onthomorpha intestinigallinarum]
PILTHLDNLDRKALKKILTEPKNAITKQYKKLFELDGVDLSFEPEALDYFVDVAVEHELGARGLRGIMEAVMMNLMFEVPGKKTLKSFVVTRQYAQEQFEANGKGLLKDKN